jgi:predicted amidohydrolase YtcJ
VAVKGGKIVGVGSNSEIKQYCNPKTESIDLKGKILLPGFVESHNHTSAYSHTILQLDCSSNANKSIDDILAKVKAKAESIPKGTWIEGYGYNHTLLAEKRHINRWDLDKVATEHPVHLWHISGHFTAVNSLALKMAGITKDTPDPEGGTIFREENGEPNGVVAEPAAQLPLLKLIPPKTVDELAEGLGRVNDEYVKAGVTSTHDANLGVFGGLSELQVLERARERGLFHPRMYALLWYTMLEDLLKQGVAINDIGICTGCGDEWLKAGGVKIWADGSLPGKTCAVFEPFLDDPKDTGHLNHTQEELNELVLKYHKAGFQLAIHGNGDRAIDVILNAYEAALAAYPRSNHRHRIEHASMATEDQLKRMARSGVVATFMTPNIPGVGDRLRDTILGPERASRIFPTKSALNHGIIFGLHGDCPVYPISPIMCLHTAVNRETSSGKILGEDQRIVVEEALKALTIDGAYIAFEEHTKGSIEIGKLADFVALSTDPFKVKPAELKDLQVELTIIDGKIVYKS